MSVWKTNTAITGGAIIFAFAVVIILARFSMPQAKSVVSVTPIPTTMIVAPTTIPTPETTAMPTMPTSLTKAKVTYPMNTPTPASRSSAMK